VGRAVSAALHTPQLGVQRCHRGPKFQSRYHLVPQRKPRFPKLKNETLETSEVRGPFETKVLMHYSFFGPILKARYLRITTTVGGAFECKLAHLHCTLQLLLGPFWKQDTLHITFAKGGLRQVPRLPSLKHTTVHNPDNDLIWEYETDWTRSAYPTCVLFHLISACKHCNVKASVYYQTHWSFWWVYHYKKHRFHEIFIFKPRHTGTDRTWANYAVTLNVSGASRSRFALMSFAFIYPALPS